MKTIKRRDFMRVLDLLDFEDKHRWAMDDRVRTDFVDVFVPERPGLSVILPKSDHVAESFWVIFRRVFATGEGQELADLGKRTDTELDMILYFPGVGLED